MGFSFNKGIDFWNANYYPDFGSCFFENKMAELFGEFFCNEINKDEEKKDLCNTVYETVKNNMAFFPGISLEDLDSFCFENKPVKYIKEQQYIRFPDFRNPVLKNYIIRLDINPCVGRKNAMTKIYCIPRFVGEIAVSAISKFVAGAKAISDALLDVLTKKYIKIYNLFAAKKMKKVELIDPDSDQMMKKVKVVSLCVGSDSRETFKFLENAKNPDTWNEYSKNDESAKWFFKTLRILNNASESDSELRDYEWYLHEGIISKKEDAKNTIDREVEGYLGFSKEEGREQYLGITNSVPRDLMLPVNLNRIRTDLEEQYG